MPRALFQPSSQLPAHLLTGRARISGAPADLTIEYGGYDYRRSELWFHVASDAFPPTNEGCDLHAWRPAIHYAEGEGAPLALVSDAHVSEKIDHDGSADSPTTYGADDMTTSPSFWATPTEAVAPQPLAPPKPYDW